MTTVLVLGAGGHAKVVADILQLQNVDVIGFLDDNPSTWGTHLLGLPVHGSIDRYPDFSPDGLVLGIGSNRVRKQIVARLGSSAETLWLSAIHPSASVARSARIADGVVICAHAVINPDSAIGVHAIINTSASIDHDCTINSYAHIAPGVHLAGGVHVGEGTLFGVGSQALPGCQIGDWTTIGAGATIIRNVPDQVIAKGTPARW